MGTRGERVAPRAWAQLERQIILRLSTIAEPTLGVEFALYRAQQRSSLERLVALARSPRSDEFYRRFVGSDRLDHVVARYPALASAWSRLVDDWVEATCELVERLHEDREELAAFLSIDAPLPAVETIDTDLSDRHHGGRTVARLTFAGRHAVMYKPRNVDVEARWAALLEWLLEHGSPERLIGVRVLPREHHGWIEVAEAHACRSEAEFSSFYRRTGALLCLVWLLGGNDCHRENLVAVGDMPVLVDVETLMHPGPAGVPDAGADAQTVLLYALHHSVLTAGLLPHWLPMPSGGGYESGGIGPGGAVETSVSGWSRRATNTDESAWVRKAVTLPSGHNVPHFDGRHAEPDAHLDDIVDGFVGMARFVGEIRTGLTADNGPIAAFAGTKIRVLLRGTAQYDAILHASLRPTSLRSGGARSVAIDGLVRSSIHSGMKDEERHAAETVIEEERRSLERLDVPRFELPVENSAVEWRPQWCESGLSTCRRRIAELGEAETRRQVALIHATFEARSIVDTKRPEPVNTPRGDLERAASDGEIRQTVERIVDRVEALATLGGDDTATWLTIDVHEEMRAFRLRPMGPAMYTGTTGVGLFLSAAAAVLDDDRARRLAFASVRAVRRAIADGVRPNLAIGGVMGATSVAYALAWMGRLLHDEGMLTDATTALLRVDEDEIRRDAHFDLAAGSAGAILVMLAVHSMKPDDELVERATRCGEHLLDHRTGTPASWPTGDGRRLAGLAHGASGIALALHRLTSRCGAPRFAAAADEALDYEHTLFVAEADNWRDVRPDVPEGPQYMSSWCNGACGIGMARLGQPDTPRVAQDIDAALRTATAQRLGRVDHLCCGNVGCAELLLEAGLVRDDAEARRRSRLLFTAMIDRAHRQGHWALERRVHGDSEHAGLFRGLAGIGWHGLRQLAPAQLPALGTLDGSRTVA